MKKYIIPAALACLSFPAFDDESSLDLKDGPGKDIVTTNCSLCHSLDMIQINSPFLDRKAWEAVVNKMIRVMGSPLPEKDVPEVVDYLVTNYGKK